MGKRKSQRVLTQAQVDESALRAVRCVESSVIRAALNNIRMMVQHALDTAVAVRWEDSSLGYVLTFQGVYMGVPFAANETARLQRLVSPAARVSIARSVVLRVSEEVLWTRLMRFTDKHDHRSPT